MITRPTTVPHGGGPAVAVAVLAAVVGASEAVPAVNGATHVAPAARIVDATVEAVPAKGVPVAGIDAARATMTVAPLPLPLPSLLSRPR